MMEFIFSGRLCLVHEQSASTDAAGPRLSLNASPRIRRVLRAQVKTEAHVEQLPGKHCRQHGSPLFDISCSLWLPSREYLRLRLADISQRRRRPSPASFLQPIACCVLRPKRFIAAAPAFPASRVEGPTALAGRQLRSRSPVERSASSGATSSTMPGSAPPWGGTFIQECRSAISTSFEFIGLGDAWPTPSIPPRLMLDCAPF